jgi:eukaryotic-like serine/threonine-protein kinase
MKVSPNHVSESQLRTLLFDDEDSATSLEVAAHVEHCSYCQQVLMQLSGLPTAEVDLCSTLRLLHEEDGLLEIDPATFTSSAAEIQLAPPSHPEMLGRLGRYEIERRVGAGGMGVVFKAYDTELHRAVAIKVLAPHLARNGAARQRFDRESRAAAAVVHENVVAIHNVESNNETPFLVMQYVSGESLQARIERTGPLRTEQVLRIGIQAASGLAAAHAQGIVHRDIKPGNILLEEQVDRALLTDFGLARAVDDASLTHTGVVAGTPHYMSPEQANGDLVDYRSDLFSLGAVLYFIATGHPPFRAERAMGVLHRICHAAHRPVWQVNAEIPDELSACIDRLLEKKPSRRYASATALQIAMSQLLERSRHRRSSYITKSLQKFRRHRRWYGAMAAVSTAAAALVLVAIWSTSSPPSAVTTESPTASPVASEFSAPDTASFLDEIEQLHRAIDKVEDFPRSSLDSTGPSAWQGELSEIERQLNLMQQQLDGTQ